MKSLKYTFVVVLGSMMFQNCISFYYEVSQKNGNYDYYLSPIDHIKFDSIACGTKLIKSGVNFRGDFWTDRINDRTNDTLSYEDARKYFSFDIKFSYFDIVPEIIIHSLYLSDSRGDIIPYWIGWYGNDSTVLIKSLPFTINEENTEGTKREYTSVHYTTCMVKSFSVSAQSNQWILREREFKKTFVNYDIEINGKRYTDSVLFRKQLLFDFGY